MKALKTLLLDYDEYNDEDIRKEAERLIDLGYSVVKITLSMNGKDTVIYYGG